MRRPDNSPSLPPTHSITVSIINPSYGCLLTASKETALPRSHPPRQPNPHNGVRGILRAPPPAGSFLGGFRTPATGVCRAAVAGRHPKPSTQAEVRREPGMPDGKVVLIGSASRQMASDEMAVAALLQFGRRLLAARLGDGAARVEMAAFRRVHRARHVALQADPLALHLRVRHRHGGEQRLRVGVLRVAV